MWLQTLAFRRSYQLIPRLAGSQQTHAESGVSHGKRRRLDGVLCKQKWRVVWLARLISRLPLGHPN